MADTCAHCGPINTFSGVREAVNPQCPDHGLVATGKRAIEAQNLLQVMSGACAQHPDAPVIGGMCGGCTQYPPTIDPFTKAIEGAITPGKLMADLIMPFTTTVEGPLNGPPYTIEKIAETLRDLPPVQRAPRHPDTVRRDRYATAIRDELKAATVPSVIPGGAPTLGATEFDMADVALALADSESAQLLAERNAALRIAEVWADAPDPACRAMAADLQSAIRGARAARLLDCGWCYEENGEEVHPHPECPIGRPATEATDTTKCPPGVHSSFDPCPGNCTLPLADTGVTIPAALTPASPEEKSRQLAAQAAAAQCGDTTTGAFGNTLGPCINDPGHEKTYHRDARGAQWCYYGTTKYSPELVTLLARTIHRYDYDHGLTGNDIPGAHQRGEAAAVLTALEEFLDIADAEAWCKSCRRVWDSRFHRCESDAEQQLATLGREHDQLVVRVEQLMRTLHAIRRFNQLTADGSRVQAAENARDNLDLLRDTLPVPVHLAAGSARAEFLSLCAQWGLTTGKGSREIVARILQHHAHEVADNLRAWARYGDDSGAEEYGSSSNVLDGADRIDPYSPHYIGAQQ
ncbi:hypothetical protein ACUXZZ_45240 (plasmid) [Streptomyces graminifolii]|uniref:hypothetical protein n=1 Tax=Streptomyces graminifolii TaxID=1266771 RepID=UPI00405A2DA9